MNTLDLILIFTAFGNIFSSSTIWKNNNNKKERTDQKKQHSDMFNLDD